MSTEAGAAETPSTEELCTAFDPAANGGLPPGFDDNFGWLLAQCFRAHLAAIDRVTAALPHGPRGYQALSGAVNCTARSQAELAKQLGVDRTVMVYLVDDLERAGLVERLPDPNDRRSRLIRATADGAARLKEVEAGVGAAEAALLAPLSPAEQQLLHTMLRQVVSAYHAAGGAGAVGGSPCELAERVVKSDC
jgi:MarR family transcriptional regulator, transcriptional regulator for hemolysin